MPRQCRSLDSSTVSAFRASVCAFCPQPFELALCELWHFDSNGRVVGGDLYYDQVSLLTQLGLMPQPPDA